MCLRAIDLEDIHLPQNPIFVMGYPRSGTTLLQALLSTQRHIYSLPETHFFSAVYDVIQTDYQGYIEESCLQQVFDAIFKKMTLRFESLEIERIVFSAKTRLLKPKHLFEYIVYRYIHREIDPADVKQRFRWLEKTPSHALFLSRILSWYPQAQYVYILRHPTPAICSRRINFPFNRETPVEVLAKRWKTYVDSMEEFAAQYPAKIYTIKYEDLTADMETELGKLGDFLELSIDTSLLERYRSRARQVILAAEPWKQRNIDADFLNTNNDYESVLTEEDSRIVETILKDSMTRYGYNPFQRTNR